ncbi:MAG TPA: tRNA pseudouridine(55) synthase TruB [bacterium]|nr:tRNA pseudouridine(55) synthase TruB [bacterium]
MDGVLNLLKPPGMTSHDVVNVVRRAAGLRRVGHTGTLDPGAAGVLVCCVGRATRLSEILMETDKEYRVELRLGVRTSTGDAYGERVAPAETSGARRPVTRQALEAVLQRFTGQILQVPPMVSAIHHDGERLYRLARRGEAVDLQPRSVVVQRIDILWTGHDHLSALLEVACGKGTYIRKLCADIGDAMGWGGYAHFMVRTRAGRFSLRDAVTLEELAEGAGRGALADVMVPMDEAVGHLPVVDLSERSVIDVLNGHPIPLWKVGETGLSEDLPVRLRSRRGALIALAKVDGGLLRPFKVLAGTGGGLVAHRPRSG